MDQLNFGSELIPRITARAIFFLSVLVIPRSVIVGSPGVVGRRVVVFSVNVVAPLAPSVLAMTLRSTAAAVLAFADVRV